MYSFSYLEPVCCSMSSPNYCFLTCIQISQEAGQVVWYSHFLKNFPQFIVIHTVKGFGIVNKAEIDAFLELSCFFHDPADVGNLIFGSSAFSKTSLNIWTLVHWSLKWKYCHLLLDYVQFTLIHGPNIPGSYAILFFTASDFTFTTRHIHNWESFLLWSKCYILSGVISNGPPLFPCSILDTFHPGGLIFWCNIFLPSYTVHGVF